MPVKFRDDFGCYWPDYDHKPEKCFRMINGYLNSMDHAIGILTKDRRRQVAVQAGGHAGFWPAKLALHFDEVYTFEPEPELFQCMRLNNQEIWQRNNICMIEAALGDSDYPLRLKSHPSAGSWKIDSLGEHIVEQVRIDDLDLSACDAIFLDIEGYEKTALRGAARTIEQFRPVIHIEVDYSDKQDSHNFMQRRGYRLEKDLGRDCVYVHA